MRTQVEKPALNSAKYECVTGFIATIVGALGVPFYIEATSKLGWKDESSSIVANVLGIILFTKGSLDYLYGLIQKGEYAKATGVVITAAVLYSPQVLIVWMETNKSLFGMNLFDTKLFSAIATGLSGAFTAAYAVAQIPGIFYSGKAAIEGQFCSQATSGQKEVKVNILANLGILIDRIRVSRRDVGFAIPDNFTRQQLLEVALRMARTAPTPCVENAGSLSTYAASGLGWMFALTLLYGTLFSYGCGTEKSLRDDFKLNPMIAFVLSIVLLSFQYLLNFTGGFGVARGVVDSLGLMNFGRFMPNEKTLGGPAGVALTLAAPILAVVSSSFSGAPTVEFSKTCHSSVVKPILFSGYGEIAGYSACFFNAIFVAKFFYFVHMLAVQRFGSEQDRNLLFVLDQLSALVALVNKTPAEEVSELFSDHDADDSAAVIVVDDDSNAAASSATATTSEINFEVLRLPPAEFRSKFFSTPVVGSSSSASSMLTRSNSQNSLESNLLAQQ